MCITSHILVRSMRDWGDGIKCAFILMCNKKKGGQSETNECICFIEIPSVSFRKKKNLHHRVSWPVGEQSSKSGGL